VKVTEIVHKGEAIRIEEGPDGLYFNRSLYRYEAWQKGKLLGWIADSVVALPPPRHTCCVCRCNSARALHDFLESCGWINQVVNQDGSSGYVYEEK